MGGIGDRTGVTPTGPLGKQAGNTKRLDAAATPAVPATPQSAKDRASVSGEAVARAQSKASHDSLLQAYPHGEVTEQQVSGLVHDVEKDGVVGSAVAFWHDMRKQEGAAGYVGATMETLLEVSGLPAVERSSAELGARVGLGDSDAHIAKAGGKLAFDCGMVMLNGVAAGGALAAAGKTAKVAAAGEALTETVATSATIVRHYTSAEKALEIMKSGEIWASKSGMAGGDKVYLLGENAGPRGMNFLRRLNIGVAKTDKAIEVDLAKLPPELASRFRTEGFRGFFNQENFITHAGTLDFKAFRDAVRVVDTEKLAVTFNQVLKAGGSLMSFGGTTVDVARGVAGVANVTRA